MGMRGPKPTTQDFKRHTGSIEIQKGQTKEGIPVVAWDAIITCEEDKCPIVHVCPYDHAGKCRVRREYIGYVHRLMLGQVEKKNTMAHFKIGMELMPLFNQLIDIKIHLYGTKPIYVTTQGNYQSNPLLKELRACLKDISNCISGMSEAFEGGGPKGIDALTGDSNYYDELFAGEPEEEDFKMRNRV